MRYLKIGDGVGGGGGGKQTSGSATGIFLNTDQQTDPNQQKLLRCRIDGTTESVMVAYTNKYAKVSVCTWSPIRTMIRYLFY